MPSPSHAKPHGVKRSTPALAAQSRRSEPPQLDQLPYPVETRDTTVRQRGPTRTSRPLGHFELPLVSGDTLGVPSCLYLCD